MLKNHLVHNVCCVIDFEIFFTSQTAQTQFILDNGTQQVVLFYQ